MKESLHFIMLDIFRFFALNNSTLSTVWVRRDENKLADYLSKYFESDSWSVSTNIFNFYNIMWGPYIFDMFADTFNTKCVAFNSKFNSPNTIGVDSFNYNWEGYVNWFVPPVYLVTKCIKHMEKCPAVGMFIVWQAAEFLPLLCNPDFSYKPYIIDSTEYVRPLGFYCSRNINSMFSNLFKSNVS